MTNSPERVLVAVLGKYDTWSISWLAKMWQLSDHNSGISQFAQGSCVAARLRRLVLSIGIEHER